MQGQTSVIPTSQKPTNANKKWLFWLKHWNNKRTALYSFRRSARNKTAAPCATVVVLRVMAVYILIWQDVGTPPSYHATQRAIHSLDMYLWPEWHQHVYTHICIRNDCFLTYSFNIYTLMLACCYIGLSLSAMPPNKIVQQQYHPVILHAVVSAVMYRVARCTRFHWCHYESSILFWVDAY